MGFVATEIMSGHHEFVAGDGPAGQLPFAFRVKWGPERIRDWINPRHPGFLWQELSGEVQIGGLCEWTPCRGTLHLEYFPKRRIRYDFDFEVDGTAYHFIGDKKNIRLWNLLVSHFTCFGVITERATGKLVSTSVSFFHLRHFPMLALVRWQ
jgi:hypothetical protein